MPDSLQELTDPYVLDIDSHLLLKTNSEKYQQEDLGSGRPMDSSILELCCYICILQ